MHGWGREKSKLRVYSRIPGAFLWRSSFANRGGGLWEVTTKINCKRYSSKIPRMCREFWWTCPWRTALGITLSQHLLMRLENKNQKILKRIYALYYSSWNHLVDTSFPYCPNPPAIIPGLGQSWSWPPQGVGKLCDESLQPYAECKACVYQKVLVIRVTLHVFLGRQSHPRMEALKSLVHMRLEVRAVLKIFCAWIYKFIFDFQYGVPKKFVLLGRSRGSWLRKAARWRLEVDQQHRSPSRQYCFWWNNIFFKRYWLQSDFNATTSKSNHHGVRLYLGFSALSSRRHLQQASLQSKSQILSLWMFRKSLRCLEMRRPCVGLSPSIQNRGKKRMFQMMIA